MSIENAFRTSRVAGPFGVAIDGIDLARIDGDAVAEVMKLLAEHHVVLVRDQVLTNETYLRFGRFWGEPITFFDPDLRSQDAPELIVIHNAASTPPERRDVALHWHSDSSYDEIAASVTMLYAVEAPDSGGETLFADMAAAWDCLPDDLRREAEGRTVRHGKGDARLMLQGEHRGGVGLDSAELREPPRPAVRHPLVIDHPVTGRRALYAVSGSAFAVDGMNEDEGIDLLLQLKQFATRDQFVQRMKASSGDVLIWDNFAVMHSATPGPYSDADGERRFLHRISTRDIAPWKAVDHATEVDRPA